MNQKDRLARAQGCLLGQLAGDSLGGLVEFCTPESIASRYPGGVRELADGGTWGTIAGQPTDDSEMALALGRSLVAESTYDREKVRAAYIDWYYSNPFDCGATVMGGLTGEPNSLSQANGAMMRISPLGVFCATHSLEEVARWAQEDAAITHPNEVCVQANALFAMAIACAISSGIGALELYSKVKTWAEELPASEPLRRIIAQAQDAPPLHYVSQQGWVLVAFQNALWQLLHASSLEEGVVDTVMRGGDTDTNAAITGALLGSVYGRDAVPAQWVEALLNCRADSSTRTVNRPRPECYWPVDALELAESLLLGTSARGA
jgi:ADP-ribosylglycohydrolase